MQGEAVSRLEEKKKTGITLLYSGRYRRVASLAPSFQKKRKKGAKDGGYVPYSNGKTVSRPLPSHRRGADWALSKKERKKGKSTQ